MLKQSETDKQKKRNNAATFGWLCVETDDNRDELFLNCGSHLRVAVC